MSISKKISQRMTSFFIKDECKKDYAFGRQLGSGSFATVCLGREKVSGDEYAIKCIKKAALTQEDFDALDVEVESMEKVDHPNIVKLKCIYDTPTVFYMVTEFMKGGELFDRVVDKEKYTEEEAQITVFQLADALLHCHNLGVVHRDLKPENLLYATKEDDAAIKIADFGLAKIVGDNVMMKTACGTPGYVAPEILRGKKYGEKVDVWSLGVIAYILLCGYPPFYDTNNSALFSKIKAGAYDFPSPYWDPVSKGAIAFIRSLLTVDPAQRPSMADVMKAPWLAKEARVATVLPDVPAKMKEFNAKRKFKVGMNAAKAAARLAAFSNAQGVSADSPATKSRAVAVATLAAANAAAAEAAKTSAAAAAAAAPAPAASPAAVAC